MLCCVLATSPGTEIGSRKRENLSEVDDGSGNAPPYGSGGIPPNHTGNRENLKADGNGEQIGQPAIG